MKHEKAFLNGETIRAVGSPFGVNSPKIFFNSISQGIISNQFFTDDNNGKISDLWLIDARISPGIEGGGIYSLDNLLVGMILPPIRRIDDVFAFNLSIPIFHLIQLINNTSIRSNFKIIGKQQQIIEKQEIIPEIVSKSLKSLVLLKYGTTWTSGFFISKKGCKKLFSQFKMDIFVF